MDKKCQKQFIYCICFAKLFFTCIQANAQIVPNNSLNTSVKVTNINGKTINQVKGGTSKGNNLFHGFKQFNNNNTVIFSNPVNIKNIFTTITSTSTSNINGLISVDGPANLYLINPNGFIFGNSAALQIQGSFFVLAAEKLKFSDGLEFNTRQDKNYLLSEGELLKVNLNRNSGSISINGNGNKIKSIPNAESLIGIGNSTEGLISQPSKSLVFVGNGININGGILFAPSGNIIIGSILDGDFNISLDRNSDIYNASNILSFSNLDIDNKSLIDITGDLQSSVKIVGKDITLRNSSLILNQVKSFNSRDKIYIKADGSLKINGKLSPSVSTPTSLSNLFSVSAGIYSQNIIGNGTDIFIDSENLSLLNGGSILSTSSRLGSTGLVTVNNTKLISIVGTNDNNTRQDSTIRSLVDGKSTGNSISISSQNLLVKDTNGVSSIVLGSGQGSDININIRDDIIITGLVTSVLSPALISSFSFGSGNSGKISLNAKNISLSNAGSISSSTNASGSSGNIEIYSDNISIEGSTTVESPFKSTIAAISSPPPPSIQAFFNLPSSASGNAGKLDIFAKNIVIKNGGQITVSSLDSGNTGKLTVRSENLTLENLSILAAAASSEDGGDIEIFSKKITLNDSIIGVISNASGRGGNIIINSDIFLAIGNSTITANSRGFKGGNITFNTKGFFSSPDTEITATSALGAQFDGSVTFNNPDRDLELAITTLETKPKESEISSVCNPESADSFSEFFVSGEGGLPTGATDQLTIASGWHDPSGGSEQPSNNTVQNPEIVDIDDAQGWVINPDGTGSLVSYSNLPITKAEKPNNCNAKTSPDTPTATHPQPDHTSPNPTISTRPHAPKAATARANPTHSATTTAP